jgi:hypothetical protein
MLVQPLTDHTPQPMGPSRLEQEDRGGPCTPMDEGALFATPSKEKNGTIYLKFSEKIVLSTCRIFKRWTGVG